MPSHFQSLARRLLLSLALLGTSACSGGVFAAGCQADSEIAASASEAPVAVARSFTDAILQGRAQAADAMLSPALRKELQPAQLAALIAEIKRKGPYSGVRTDHVYRVSVTGSGTIPPVLCGTMSDPDHAVTVAADAIPEQYHIVLRASARSSDWAITVWLVPSGQGWVVQGFYAGMQSVSGRDAHEILIEARQQRDAHHDLNAALLYAMLRDLTDRGPGLRLGITAQIRDDMEAFRVPPELAGRPPFRLNWNGKVFAVDQMQVIGVDHTLSLAILYADPRWDGKDSAQADTINREMIDAFRKTHPEYAEIFASVVARLERADKHGGFATVYENAKGYRKPKDTTIAAPAT